MENLPTKSERRFIWLPWAIAAGVVGLWLLGVLIVRRNDSPGPPSKRALIGVPPRERVPAIEPATSIHECAANEPGLPTGARRIPASRCSPGFIGSAGVNKRSQTRPQQVDLHAERRRLMVQKHLRGRDIHDAAVLDAMSRIERHRFVDAPYEHLAYIDRPLPIGHRQTISQPYMVALMTQLARPKSNSRTLDIGTGSGYQAAVLAEIVKHVYSIDILCPLANQARKRLAKLGYKNVTVRCGDGYGGWAEHAPFDVIIVAAAPDHVPQPLVDQLATGGRMIIPVGEWSQQLLVIEKQADGKVTKTVVAPVAFVPMTGRAEKKDR